MRIIRPVKVTKDGTFTRASTGTYWDKTGVMRTAVANTLRITYDPANLKKAPYAMIEPAATNLLLWSEDFSNAASWGNAGKCTVTTDSTLAPDGTTGADTLTANVSDSYVAQSLVGPTAGSTITLSVWLRADSPMSFDIYVTDRGVSGNSRTTCSVTTTWKRFSVTRTAPAGATGVDIQIGGGSSFPTGKVLYVWGAQAETGTLATSYIKTAGSTVTRAADVVGSTGLVYTNVPENDYPAWSATKVYAQGDRVLDLPNHKVLESINGQIGAATFIAASAGNVTMKKADGTTYVPVVGNAVVFTGTTPPTGIVSGTTYYVQAVTATAFSVSATLGGAAITTGAQATPMTALTSPNLNIPITNPLQWLDAGYDNRWDMFDDSITSQTSQAGDIVISFYAGTRLDSIAAFNLVANSMTISFVDVVTGEYLYSASANLISNSGIQDFYAYLYEPIVQATECLVDHIPLGLSANSLITVTFSSNGTTKVGGLVFGLEKDIGVTEWGTKVGIIDYSVKTKDTFGNYTITPRAFSKRGDFTVQVPTAQVDTLQSLLAQFRATPIVYIGSNSGDRTQFNSTMIYGFYKDFDINIAYNAYSVCSMTVEGLT